MTINELNDVEAEDAEVTDVFVDQNPERDYASSDRLGWILGITGRQVRSLATSGVLSRAANGQFKILEAAEEYRAYKSAPPPKAVEALARRQIELLDRRIAREELELIDMVDALETIDHISVALMVGFDQIAAASIAIAADPERAKTACEHTRAGLVEQFGRHRLALQTGKRASKNG